VGVLERAVLGAVMDRPDLHGPMFLERLPLEQFSGGRRLVAQVLISMLLDEKAISPALVVEELRVQNLLSQTVPAEVFDCYSLGYNAPFPEADIAALSRIYLSRDVYALGVRVQQSSQSMEVSDVLAVTAQEVARLQALDEGRMPPVLTYLDDVLHGEDVSIDWLVDGIIPRGSSMMLTAEEGVGKSTLLRQIALAASSGLQPFQPVSPRGRPIRVLLVDCEVSRNQLVRSLRSLWSYACGHLDHPDTFTKMLAVESRQAGWDLTHGPDQAELHRIVKAHRPDLLVIGPVYRFADSDLNTEEGVRAWQKPFEPLMAEGISFITEHHAPNGDPGQRRALRPIGSSAMRRWFAQGLAVRAMKCRHGVMFCTERNCTRRAQVEHWRGPRDESRWPRHLGGIAGVPWWLAVDDEEAERWEQSKGVPF